MASNRPAAPPGDARPRRKSPAGWLAAYDDFIAKNVGQVSQIESALRSLTYVIPGRFRDAEIASEAIHSGVQLLSLYHDLLLQRTPLVIRPSSSPSPSSSKSAATGPPPSQHTRYTRFWAEKSPLYRRVAIVLQVVRYTELLCEMAAKRRGERLRWRVVVLIEAVKAVCKLLLLRITKGRTLLTPALPVRQPLPEVDEEEDEELVAEEEEKEEDKAKDNVEGEQEAADEHNQGTSGAATLKPSVISPQPPLSPPPSPLRTPADATPEKALAPPVAITLPSPPPTEGTASTISASSAHCGKGWAMPRTGMALPPLPQPGDISSYLLSRVLTADDIKPATKLLTPLRGAAQAAEVLHILAPLVYAVALARTYGGSSNGQDGKRRSMASTWAPWLAGLAMELAARQLREHDNRNSSLRTTTLEREEWSRRGWALGWWSMRGAFYEHAMKGVVAGVRRRLPSFVGGVLEDYEYLWENYYFSTSP